MSSSVDLVNQAYAAFGTGNLPGLLALCSDDTVWTVSFDLVGMRVGWGYDGPLASASARRKSEQHALTQLIDEL